MKTKIVVEGSIGLEDELQKFLLALELKPTENKVHSWLIPVISLDENSLHDFGEAWIKKVTSDMPEGAQFSECSLSASQSILPEGFSTTKQDFVSRTQTEWLFIVLSTKLFQRYQEELNELKEQVEQLSIYSKPKWESMKLFWSKVQNQINEKNLFKDHSLILKNQTNNLFAYLKKLRSAQDAVYEKSAQQNFDKLMEKLQHVEAAVKKGLNLDEIFNTLKQLQTEFKNTQLTRTLRSQFWEKIDAIFKEVKLKRNPDSTPQDRLTRRIEGLVEAISKMQRSINKDQKELSVQTKRLNASDLSQLENQLREVRAKLIKERIASKSEKLKAMNKTLEDLNKKQKRALHQLQKEHIKEAQTATIETTSLQLDKESPVKPESNVQSSNMPTAEFVATTDTIERNKDEEE